MLFSLSLSLSPSLLVGYRSIKLLVCKTAFYVLPFVLVAEKNMCMKKEKKKAEANI